MPHRYKNSVENAQPITASIIEINMNGVVVVQFSEYVIIPKQYNEFDDTILKVQVILDTSKDDENFKRNNNLTSWTIEDFTDI